MQGITLQQPVSNIVELRFGDKIQYPLHQSCRILLRQIVRLDGDKHTAQHFRFRHLGFPPFIDLATCGETAGYIWA